MFTMRSVIRDGLVLGLVLSVCSPLPVLSQDASDIPLWFDVAAGPPPNVKLNTDVTTELQNEEQVAVDPTNPDNLVAVWRDFRLGYRQVGWGYSHDGGFTWTEGGLLATTSYERDSDPGVIATSDGTFYALVVSFDPVTDDRELSMSISFDSGHSWFGPLLVADEAGIREDKGWMTVDRTGGPTNGNLYVSFTGDSELGYYIYSASSIGGGAFSPSVLVSDATLTQWSVPAVDTGGHVLTAWYSYAHPGIMCDYSTDQGATWGTDRVLANTVQLDYGLNGGIATFLYPALCSDVTNGPYRGRFYCAFPDTAADGLLDLYMTVSDDASQTWSPRVRINDDPAQNYIDQFHPWIAINPDGVVSVVWYDRRLDPTNLSFDAYISHSFDGGQSWTPNQRVSEVSSSPLDAAVVDRASGLAPIDPRVPSGFRAPRAGLIGEYIGLATSVRRATVVFTDTRNGNQDVYAANMPLRLFPPKLTGPVDGLITDNPIVTFTWDDWSIYDEALTHTLEYSSDSTFTTGVTRIDDLAVQSMAETLPEGRTHWRVRAFDTFGDSSDVVRHSVWIDTTAPEAPIPLAPSPMSTDTISDPTPEFAWSDESDPIGTPVSYELQIASDSGFTEELRTYVDLSATSFTIPDLDSLTLDQCWHWRVMAKDQVGKVSPFSELQTFYPETLFLVGDLNGDGVFDVVDLNALINVIFFNGQVPVPPDARADLNCDGMPDTVDLNQLIGVIFFNGTPPTCP